MVEALGDVENDRIAFKGGSALELRFGFTARASADLDAACRGEIDDAFALVSRALAKGWCNFAGRLTQPREIGGAPVHPRPHRADAKLTYKGKSFTTIPIEISAAEGRSLEEIERVGCAVELAPVQLPTPASLPFLPLRYQVAQKLHACTEVFDDGTLNSRVRDLADLLLMRDLAMEEGQYAATKSACVEIFDGRKKQPWPPTLVAGSDWGLIWAGLMADGDTTLSLADAIREVQAFILAIDAAK